GGRAVRGVGEHLRLLDQVEHRCRHRTPCRHCRSGGPRMTSPAYLEPHGTDIHDGDEAWQHWPKCEVCNWPADPEGSYMSHGYVVCEDCTFQCDDGPRWCAECAEGVAI